MGRATAVEPFSLRPDGHTGRPLQCDAIRAAEAERRELMTPAGTSSGSEGGEMAELGADALADPGAECVGGRPVIATASRRY